MIDGMQGQVYSWQFGLGNNVGLNPSYWAFILLYVPRN
jgi:hypothetical protein